jgi:hypothetical protein
MDLFEYFTHLCRELGAHLNADGFSEKKLLHPRKATQQNGICARIDFEGFKIMLSYIEQGRAAYVPQTIWVSVSIDACPGIPFSLYDILAFIQPQNFNCYTYTYVDSLELMKSCIDDLSGILQETTTSLKELLKDGISKNKLIASQKDNINHYFGDNILESGEMLGGSADKIIAMMLENFYEAEIEAAVVGTQSYFYNGDTKKALKKLQKAKHRTLYQDNLLKHISNGGQPQKKTTAVKQASSKEGYARHGGSLKDCLKLMLLSILLEIPLTAVFTLFYAIASHMLYKDSIFTFGFEESWWPIPFFCFMLALAIASLITRKKERKKKTDGKTVHAPRESEITKGFFKYFTIIAETLAIIGCLSSAFSIVPFYEDHFCYPEGDFPLSQHECRYEAIEYAAIVEGYYADKTFIEEEYIVLHTISGKTIDLYNSTWNSCDELRKNENFFKEKDIEIKHFKTFDEYEKNK